MKKVLMSYLAVFLSLSALAQSTQPCVVKQYNQKEQKTPLLGVEVMVSNAGSTVSDNEGKLTLSFRTLKPGDKVNLVRAKKAGFEIFNSEAVQQWYISREQKAFELVMVQSDYFYSLKAKLKQSSVDNYKRKYEQAKSMLEKSQKEGKLKEQEYFQRLDELENHYDHQLQSLDTYVDQFARFDLSELSEQERQFVDLAHAGRLDEAAEAYSSLDAAGKYTTAVENVHKLNEDISKLEAERDQQQVMANSLYAMLKRQVATLELAGGEENFKKAGELLKRAALADTMNVLAVGEYAEFAYRENNLEEAEQYWLLCLRNTKDNLYLMESFLNNLGVLYCSVQNYEKAEECYLSNLNVYITLCKLMPESYLDDLASTQNNLGNLYIRARDFAKSEEYLLDALENRQWLYSQYPDAYCSELAMTQHNLGALYTEARVYPEAEDYLLKALDTFSQLYAENPKTYRELLAKTQNYLGVLYFRIGDFAKSEEYFLRALEHYTQLFSENPSAFCLDWAIVQQNLGGVYIKLQDFGKSEQYLLKALDKYTELFRSNPDAYRAGLASIQNTLGGLYFNLRDYAKSEEYYLGALENRRFLFAHNPDANQEDLANVLNNLGSLYGIIKNYDRANEFYQDALENITGLFTRDSVLYRSDLADIQNRMGELFMEELDYTQAADYLFKSWKNYSALEEKNPGPFRDRLSRVRGKLIHAYVEDVSGLSYRFMSFVPTLSQRASSYSSEDWIIITSEFQLLHDAYQIAYRDLSIEELDCIDDAISFSNALLPNSRKLSSTLLVDGLEYVIDNPTNSQLEEWIVRNRDICVEKIKRINKNEDYGIPEEFLTRDPCLVYFILHSQSISEENKKQEWLDSYLRMDRNQRDKLYSILYREHYELGLLYKQDKARDYNANAYVMAQEGDYYYAFSMIDRAIELFPEVPDFYDSKGEFYLMQGRLERALSMWNKVLELDPGFLEKHQGGTKLYCGLKEKGLIQ